MLSGKTTRIVLSFLGVTVALVILMPRNARFMYEYKIGHEWKYETLYAQFDFPLLKTDDQLMSEWGVNNQRAIVPYYRLDPEVERVAEEKAQSMDIESLSPLVTREIQSIYDFGVIGDEGVHSDDPELKPDIIFIQKEKHAVKCPASEVLTVSSARAKLRDDISSMGVGMNVDSVFRAQGVYDLIVPNLSYDSQTTTLVSAATGSDIAPTSGYVATGELIVATGEIVTDEIAQVLDSYKKEYEANNGYSGPRFLMWLGNGLIAIAFVLLLFVAIFFSDATILQDNRLYFVILVYLLSSVGAMLLVKQDASTYCLMPFILAALYLQTFFPPKVIFSVYTVSLLPILVFAPSGKMLFVMFLLSGLVAAYAFKSLNKGWRQFLMALIAFLVMVFVYLGFRFTGLSGVMGTNVWNMLMCMFGGSILAVAGYTFITLFEKMFNLVSDSTLQDYCDPSNSLIRSLEQKAPGTFQHSLQVMNMADVVARAIGANPLLVRTGALYHDIGKMNNPQCFVENESLIYKPEEEKYHYSLTPLQSSHDIIRHMTDGVEIAQKHHLPDILVDFIRSHHGTSHTGYFYQKYLQEGGSPEHESEFCYPGLKPVTKEQVILMLCDSIEAGSRSLKERTPEAYSNFVDSIVKGKIVQGQLDDADISLQELRVVTQSIKSYLAQMHHGRIAYPEENKKIIISRKKNKNHESRKESD